MTKADIERISELFAAAGRTHIPVPLSEWRAERMSRIGSATVKTNPAGKKSVTPVSKISATARRAAHAKTSRAVVAWDAASSPAYKAGEKAGLAGKPIDPAPFDGRTKEGKAWRIGHALGAKAAKKAAKKAKAA